MTDLNNQEKFLILIVDDKLENLKTLVLHLKRHGFGIILAQSGEEALERIEHVTPDLILLDVLMPVIDGFETCRRLKKHETAKDIPVIFMTALSDTVDKIKGFDMGGVDYITKPFQHEEVQARIQTHLTIRKLQQQLQAQNVLLKEQNAQLEELNASKDKFLSIIAHDLRSPFSSLRGLIRFTTENISGYNQEKLEQILELLGESTDNLYALVENLLTWSRIQRGVIEYHPQYIDIREIVARNITLFTSLAQQKQITLRNVIEEDISAYADTNMIDAVIRNLLSNAIKFTHPGGHIEIAATQDETSVEISVSDNGIGIGEKGLQKLFRIDAKYKQLGTARERGTGLGLILCKEFIEKHGGRIWIESEVEKGSTFRFTLMKKPLA